MKNNIFETAFGQKSKVSLILPFQPFQSWLLTAIDIVYLKKLFGGAGLVWKIIYGINTFLSNKMKIIKVIPAGPFLDKIIVSLL